MMEAVELSVVVPAHNEEGNVRPLVEEIVAAVDPCCDSFEIIVADDASTDGTLAALKELQATEPRLRILHLPPPPSGGGNGQSAAFKAAFSACRGPIVAVLDADLQNNPADLPAMLELLRTSGADFIQGDRSASRADGAIRRLSSWVGRSFRRLLLGDSIKDTGCSLRVLRRDIATALPLEFRGMHRFIPLTARHMGYRVVEMPVAHRLRNAGDSKYGMLNRAIPGLVDCVAMRWMRKRRRATGAEEIKS
ncbi:MAG: glycosyltransferase family 2 protein [Phycisphaerales bacterium]|jgi:glycosyltransferase involved in cell wall biosynthesis|nr:glycosyltransferase family 2 protein [Phycisphaerales bacterium]